MAAGVTTSFGPKTMPSGEPCEVKYSRHPRVARAVVWAALRTAASAETGEGVSGRRLWLTIARRSNPARSNASVRSRRALSKAWIGRPSLVRQSAAMITALQSSKRDWA